MLVMCACVPLCCVTVLHPFSLGLSLCVYIYIRTHVYELKEKYKNMGQDLCALNSRNRLTLTAIILSDSMTLHLSLSCN